MEVNAKLKIHGLKIPFPNNYFDKDEFILNSKPVIYADECKFFY